MRTPALLGAERHSGPVFTDTWWPIIALALGIVVIVVGGILYSS